MMTDKQNRIVSPYWCLGEEEKKFVSAVQVLRRCASDQLKGERRSINSEILLLLEVMFMYASDMHGLTKEMQTIHVEQIECIMLLLCAVFKNQQLSDRFDISYNNNSFLKSALQLCSVPYTHKIGITLLELFLTRHPHPNAIDCFLVNDYVLMDTVRFHRRGRPIINSKSIINIIQLFANTKVEFTKKNKDGDFFIHNIAWKGIRSDDLLEYSIDLLPKATNNPNYINNFNCTPLHFLCMNKNATTKSAALLLKLGIDPAIKSSQGRTAAEIAIENGISFLSEFLTDYANSLDKKKFLELALEGNDSKEDLVINEEPDSLVLSILDNVSTDIKQINSEKEQVQFGSDVTIDVETFESSLVAIRKFADGETMECPSSITETIACLIVYIEHLCKQDDKKTINKDIERLEKIFNWDIKIDWSCLLKDYNALYYAIVIASHKGFEKIAYKIVSLLLNKGDKKIITESLNNEGKHLPLHKICYYPCEEKFKQYDSSEILNIIKRLLNAGANHKLKDKGGSAPLAIAKENKITDIINLLENFEELKRIDNQGRNVLHLSIINKCPTEKIKKIINSDICKIDIDARDNEGKTALHHAYANNNSAIKDILIINHAKTDLKDNHGFTPSECSPQNRANSERELLELIESSKSNKSKRKPKKKKKKDKSAQSSQISVKKVPSNTQPKNPTKKTVNSKESKNAQQKLEQVNTETISKSEKIEYSPVPPLSDELLQQSLSEPNIESIEKDQPRSVDSIFSKQPDITINERHEEAEKPIRLNEMLSTMPAEPKANLLTVYPENFFEQQRKGNIELENAITTVNAYLENKPVEKLDLNEGILSLLGAITRNALSDLPKNNSLQLDPYSELINMYYELLFNVFTESQHRSDNLIDISYNDGIFEKAATVLGKIRSVKEIGESILNLLQKHIPGQSLLRSSIDKMNQSNSEIDTIFSDIDNQINPEVLEKNSVALQEFVDGKVQDCPGDITKMLSSLVYYIKHLCELGNDKKQSDHEETVNKNIDLLSKIFEKKCSLQWKLLFEDFSTLYYAASIVHCKGFEKTAYKVVDLLLKHGNTKIIKQSLNKEGECLPLYKVCDWITEKEFNESNSQQILNIIKRLLKAGADPNVRDKSGCTSLRIADVHKLSKIKNLLTIFSELNEIDEDGGNAIHRAVINKKSLSEIKEIINSDIDKVNINHKDHKGNTALHYAYNTEIFKALIEMGADRKLRNNKGSVPVEPQTYSPKIAEELLKSDAPKETKKKKKGNNITKQHQPNAKKNPTEKTTPSSKPPVKKNASNSTKQKPPEKISENSKAPQNSQKQLVETKQPDLIINEQQGETEIINPSLSINRRKPSIFAFS